MANTDRYPSVTQVLKPWSDFSRVDLDLLNMAKERGSEAHAICAAIAQGLWYEEPRPEVAGYVRSYQDWFESSVSEVCWVETKLVDDVYRFTGTPDLAVILKGDTTPSLWDIKTPRAVSHLWRYQVAAYRHLARKAGCMVERIGCLRLSPDGGPLILDEYTRTASRDFNVFLAALTCYHEIVLKGESA